MAQHKVEILELEKLTHDVKRYVTTKPDDYCFTPGQATEVAIAKEGWEDEKRPFTFTSLVEDKNLEFVIKSYRDHDGVTHKLDDLEKGDHLLIHDYWGAINYKGEGQFIAGGAGVTPFIAIFKKLATEGNIAENHLHFSNKTSKDIILKDFWEQELGDHFHSVLTQESDSRIDKKYLEENIDDFDQHFYVCGPDKMVSDITGYLKELGADVDQLVFEE